MTQKDKSDSGLTLLSRPTPLYMHVDSLPFLVRISRVYILTQLYNSRGKKKRKRKEKEIITTIYQRGNPPPKPEKSEKDNRKSKWPTTNNLVPIKPIFSSHHTLHKISIQTLATRACPTVINLNPIPGTPISCPPSIFTGNLHPLCHKPEVGPNLQNQSCLLFRRSFTVVTRT